MDKNNFTVKGIIQDYKVKFPFIPYKIQEDIISNLIKSFESNENSLIESPTGTGKTLCSLAAVMAFLEGKLNNNQYIKEKSASKHLVDFIDLLRETRRKVKSIRIILMKKSEDKKKEANYIEEILYSYNNPKTFSSIKHEIFPDCIEDYEWVIVNNHLWKNYFYEYLIKIDSTEKLDDLDNIINRSIKLYENKFKEFKNLRKIIFVVRTNSQIKNIYEEYNLIKNFYPFINISVLQSRDIYCLNDKLKNFKGVVRNELCKKIQIGDLDNLKLEKNNNKKFGCYFKNNSNFLACNYDNLLNDYNNKKACPYYGELKKSNYCDIILTTYNYLFMENCRKVFSKYISNSIIIIDEAHNIMVNCENSISYMIKLDEIYNDLKQFEILILLQNKIEKKTIEIDDEKKFEFLSNNYKFIIKYTTICIKFYNNLLFLNKNENGKIELSGSFIFFTFLKLFNNNEIDLIELNRFNIWQILNDEEKFIKLLEIFEKYFYYNNFDSDKPNLTFLNFLTLKYNNEFKQFNKEYAVHFQNTFKFLPKLFSLCKFFFEKIVLNYLDRKVKKKFIEDYYFFHNSISNNCLNDYINYTKKYPIEIIVDDKDVLNKLLNYLDEISKVNANFSEKYLIFNCLNPAVPYKIMKKKMRSTSVIFLSGTLSPFRFYKSELDEKFQNNIKTKHIIDSNRVRVLLFTKPIKFENQEINFDLSFVQKNLKKDSRNVFKCSWKIIQKFSEYCDNGCLIFLKSYEVLKNYQEFMNEESWIDKTVTTFRNKHEICIFDGNNDFVKSKKNFIFEDYKSSCQRIKSYFFTIMKGSFSEGINYKNEESSCLFILGIPYENYSSPQIEWKKKYLDKKFKEKTSEINGFKWYEIQAMISLNQAIGRAIRKKDDYAVICIVDSKISSLKKYLSRWIEPEMIIEVNDDNFENEINKTKEFYKNFQNK